MSIKNKAEYFLGANTAYGFYSLYDSLYFPEKERLYIIKGGAGCGKSSFMRNIASKIELSGEKVEYVYCSGDPKSIDAVYFPSLKAAICDGTSPHIAEPKYPALSENYINLGAYYDENALTAHKDDIIRLFAEYKSHYAEAYDLLSRYGAVKKAILPDVSPLRSKIDKKADSILKKYGVPSAVPTHKKRFLKAVSCDGIVEKYSELEKYGSAVILGGNAALCDALCKAIEKRASSLGVSTVSYQNPVLPEMIDHIAIPDSGAIFVSSCALISREIRADKTVRLDTMMKKDERKRYHKLEKLSKKLLCELTDEAETELLSAKKLHDELEAIYNPYIDFDSVYSLSDKYAEKIVRDNK